MTLLRRACVSPYYYFTNIMSVCRTVSENQTGSIRKLGCGFLSAFHSITMAVTMAVYEILSVKNSVTLKTGLGVVQGH